MSRKEVARRAATGRAGENDADAYAASMPHYSTSARNTQVSSFLPHALRYALAGWPVIPLAPGGKTPLTAHGVHDGTTDLEQIAAWWQRWPNANVGIVICNERVVLDVDPRNGGDLSHLARLGLDMSQAPTQRTAGGGWHVVYARPRGVEFAQRLAELPGLDILTGDKYIVAEPSIVGGRQYRWERHPLDVDPPRLPLDVAERLRKRVAAARADDRPAAQSGPRGDAPPLHVLEHALAHLDPWAGNYSWWLSILMALHSAYPGADGLALAERWGDGKPGEIASKWATFDAAGGVTVATLLHHAKQAGWRPELATPDAPTMDTAHRLLHDALKHARGDCPICGNSFFETAIVDSEVRGRRRVMMCHRRDCATWQTYRTEKQIMERRPWEWSAWFASEHTPDEWRALVNGPLAERGDWLGAPLVNGNIALFAGFAARKTAVGVSLATCLSMAAERIMSIPAGKRLRKPKDKARARRVQADNQEARAGEALDAAPAADGGTRLHWTRWSFGLDLLSPVDAWTVLAIIERAGGVVAPNGSFRYPLSIDAKVRQAVASWAKPERAEINAYRPLADNAFISPGPPLPEQPGYRNMPERLRKQARLLLLEDTEWAYRQRESIRRM